jgi:hypothetical protein
MIAALPALSFRDSMNQTLKLLASAWSVITLASPVLQSAESGIHPDEKWC